MKFNVTGSGDFLAGALPELPLVFLLACGACAVASTAPNTKGKAMPKQMAQRGKRNVRLLEECVCEAMVFNLVKASCAPLGAVR